MAAATRTIQGRRYTMHIVDIISWTIMGAVAAVLIIAFIALIILAFKWDDMEEEYWEEYWGKDEEE